MERLDLEVKFAAGDEAGTITGLASPFGGEADAYGDTIAPGAFAKSLAEHTAKGSKPLMLWMHDTYEPVGVWTEIREDGAGLQVKGRIITETSRGRDAYALLKAGALNGLSIGYRVRDAERLKGGGRLLKQIDLAEISLVTFPAADAARIQSVKTDPTAAKGAASEQEDHMEQQTPEAAAPDLSGLTQQIAEINDHLKGLKGRVDGVEVKLGRPAIIEHKGDEDPAKAEMKAFTSFIRKGAAGLTADELKSLRVADNESGGYLAPAELVAQIDKDVVQFSPVRSVATVRTTGAPEVNTLRRTQGASAWWVGEEEDRTETEVKWGAQNYPVHEIGTFVDVSLQLLEDATLDVASELSMEFAEAFGSLESAAFVNGNGVKKPMGFMADADIVSTNSGHATQVTADGLIDLYHGVKTPYRGNAVWGMNSTTLGACRKLKDTSGQYLLLTTPINGAPLTTLLGRPVIEMPDLPDIGAGAFPIIFGDFGQGYRIFDRLALSVVRDDLTQRTKGRVRFHARRRLAAGVRKAEAIRKLKIAA
ncbi:MAG: phage major capsid protein [Caenispirillum sp.]|nr:phage major capsid protein [Caenispirillum sp.]